MKQQFLMLYERNVDAVFRFCYRKTGNRETAMKLTDETFKKMWDYITPGYPLSEMASTLYAIASRLLRQHAIKNNKASIPSTFKFS
jgi:DNA-directed RNA polymerase specialized sigma24 family protein